jgi:hypothetical protein
MLDPSSSPSADIMARRCSADDSTRKNMAIDGLLRAPSGLKMWIRRRSCFLFSPLLLSCALR